MHHMKSVSVRDIRYRFSEVEDHLRHGETIQLTKRRRVIARLTPVKPPTRHKSPPDFMALLRKIYGNKIAKISGADMISEQRGRY